MKMVKAEEKNRRGKIKGFTLFEAMAATAIFMLLMTVLFSIIKDFQNLMIPTSQKQITNNKVIKIYNSINTDISLSSYRYITSYNDLKIHDAENDAAALKSRALMMPISKGGLGSDGYPLWDNLILYALVPPENHQCDAKPECPHKKLKRYELEIVNATRTAELNRLNFQKDMIFYSSKIKTILSSKVGDKIELTPKQYLIFRKSSNIEHEVADISVDTQNENMVKLRVIFFNYADAKKKVRLSDDMNLSQGSLKPFVDDFSWLSTTNN